MIEVLIVDLTRCPPLEYFCRSCGQLRLAFGSVSACGNCRGGDLVSGAVGTLDKDALKSALLP